MNQAGERRQGGKDIPGKAVPPGGIVLVQDGTNLIAVVGPGVAVCLWNEATQTACLAHFCQAAVYERVNATARFGNVAIPTAVEMIRKSVVGGRLEAQIFGGAARVEDGRESAEANIEMARRILAQRGVPVVSEDVGGEKGRKIVFQTTTGHVAVVKVHRLRAEDWNP
ncbi:MAG: chemotaxis protein CheD [Fibrobacteria bacterium]|nr:chemotaxis protein CheD [Fibrobacteria bacterium]